MIFYGPKETPEAPELGQEVTEVATSRQGAPWGVGRAPAACGHLKHPLDVRLTAKILINTQTSKKNPRSEVPPPQAFVATKNPLGARSGTLPEGKPSLEAILFEAGAPS